MIPLLTSMIVTPLVGAGIILMRSCRDQEIRLWACLAALVTAVLSGMMAWQFDASSVSMQFIEHRQWLPLFNMHYDLGVDGIAMPLICLTAFTNLLIVGSSWYLVKDKVAQYLAAFLILESMTIGIFSALDGILFYLFWEGTLIPMYLCIGIWGGDNRNFAAVKFFIYTFFGSALMLVALVYLGLHAQSFYIPDWVHLPMSLSVQKWLFIAFLLGFSIKVPMWPVHTWLPDAHTEAPAAGSVILAALMLKVGAYGFFRFSLPMLPDASMAFAWPMVIVSLIAVVYIGAVALAQVDMKRLIAYSSVAHMGFVTLGCFVIFLLKNNGLSVAEAQLAFEGAYIQMISHGFGSGALFLAFGLLYERYHSRQIDSFGGLASVMPLFSAFFVVFCLSNVGLPGTSGFVGEFMVILGSFKASPMVAMLAALTLIISATYTLSMVRRVFYGPLGHESLAILKDVGCGEFILLAVLVVCIFLFGLYPEGILHSVHVSSVHIITDAFKSKLVS